MDPVNGAGEATLSSHDLARLLLARRDSAVTVRIVDSPGGELTVRPVAVVYDPAGGQVIVEAHRRHR